MEVLEDLPLSCPAPEEGGRADLCDHAYNADCHRLRQRMLEADSDLGR